MGGAIRKLSGRISQQVEHRRLPDGAPCSDTPTAKPCSCPEGDERSPSEQLHDYDARSPKGSWSTHGPLPLASRLLQPSHR